MSLLTSTFFRKLPYWLKDVAVTIYNTRSYYQRRTGKYQHWRNYYDLWSKASALKLDIEAKERLSAFLQNATSKSKWYQAYQNKQLNEFPALNKKDIIDNLLTIATIPQNKAHVSLTGGTTGASMKVLYAPDDTQERHALIDHFREQHGYKLGDKVAWFSGKEFASQADVHKGRCYVDDLINSIRFMSTFHITDDNFDSYWASLEQFRPKFFVGFPSSVYDIAILAKQRGLKANWNMTTMFPTAETVLPIHRKVIGEVFGCKLVDQYASSEGAPFILECEAGGLHIHPLTGVFEVVDENMQPAQEGEILVTSFTTEGTPLIRYRVGDRIKLAPEEKKCTCGSCFPLVEKIEGRSTDFILSPTHGKVNLGNISNCTKDVKGILQFQVIQTNVTFVDVLVVCSNEFDHQQQSNFSKALTERFGPKIDINIKIVNNIPKEKSGKHRLVKNKLKQS